MWPLIPTPSSNSDEVKLGKSVSICLPRDISPARWDQRRFPTAEPQLRCKLHSGQPACLPNKGSSGSTGPCFRVPQHH